MKFPILSTVSIFRNSSGDSSNKGLSSRVKHVKVYYGFERDSQKEARGVCMDDAREMAASLDDDDVIIVEDLCFRKPRFRAIPVYLIKSKKWTMFGGAFVWTSDSRFFSHPVKMHDRVKS